MGSEEKAALLPLVDTFDEDEAEKAFLLSKPTCFLIVGKPGAGKTTLGRKLSQSWKCIFIEAKDLINEHIQRETELGVKIQEILYQGQNIPEELVTQLMIEKINSAEVAHLGYVLCGFPSLSEEYIRIPEQIALIKSLKLKPDVIINIKCPDKDLSKRLSGRKQDPVTGSVYQREQWDPALRDRVKESQEGEEEEGEEEQPEEEEEDDQSLEDVLRRLVHRPEDFPENVDERIMQYKDTLLRPLEDLIIDHDSQYLIELDGNKKPEELFGSVLSRLEYLGLRHGAVVMRLQNSEEEETFEGLDGEELFRTLSSSYMIAPRYRWRRSRWGQCCPVALKEGYIKKGLAEFSVSFLDKMYFLSSEEALMKFIQNPRPYLLPPMPQPPCKVAVVGPKSSGKTTVCNLIAKQYVGKVFDMSQLIIPYAEEAKQRAVEKAQEEATQTAIQAVQLKLQQEILLKAQEAEKEAAEDSSTNPDTEDKEEASDEPSHSAEKEDALETEITQKEIQETPPELMEEVNPDHPEVQEMVAEAVKVASQTPITLTPDVYVNALEKAIKEFNEESDDRFPGAPPVGGWVLENFPNSPNYWIPLEEKGLLPDTVICLRDTAANGNYLLNRLYKMNEQEINNNILQRLQKERARKIQELEEARKEQQEMLRLQQEEKQKLLETEESGEDREQNAEADPVQLPADTEQAILPEPASSEEISQTSISEPEPEPEITIPAVPEGGFPDVPEMEPLKHHITTFNEEWFLLEPVFADKSIVNLTYMEIAGKSPETLLQEAVSSMEKPFQYHGYAMTSADIDDEAEDLQLELEAEEQEGEEEGKEEEEEEEQDEEIISESKRHYGDSKHFCPVALKENLMLHPGIADNAAIYREKIYYCSSPEARIQFLENPESYIVHEGPLQAPPLRVFLLGPSGSGKSVSARWLANKLGIFHIQFQERLQEMMLSKLEKKVGPKFEEEVAEDSSVDEEDLLGSENVSVDNKQSEKVSTEEVVLTEEEEAIRSYLVDSEPLPTEVLDQLVSEWWTKEPFRSAGFILDGFPCTVEEVQYIGECGFFPDVAILLEVEENDVCDRLIPARLAKWRERKMKKEAKKQKIREMKQKLRDEQIAKRRAELLAEQNKLNEEKMEKDDPEASDEDEDEADDIEQILSEEFPEEEEEEDEEDEQEEDAIERMKTEIGEKCEADTENLQAVKEELESLNIPFVTINGGRKPHIVCYQLYDKLKQIIENRESLFEKCYPVSFMLASKMLHVSYKQPSIFGRWDPVKLSQGEVIKPFHNQENPGFPLIYRQHIYFFSTKENRNTFMKNPIKYLRQPKPKPSVPMRIAILGPPKSGKTTVAKMFASVYGLQRLSIGDAIRSVLENQPDTELASEIKNNLVKGLTVPDELAIKCLEVAMMDLTCNTTGLVLDGYPATKQQVDLLEAFCVIPIKIFELQLSMKEVLKRGATDKKNSKRPYPEHDSAQILAMRYSCYKQEVHRIKEYYMKLHQNWCEADALRSKWWISNKIIGEVQTSINQVQTYLERIKNGKAAAIADFCISPQELLSRLGEFGQYCPVSLAQSGELVNCSETISLRFAAEFRGRYYKMASQEQLDAFLEAPELYVPPLAPRPLPPQEMLPKKLTVANVKTKFPKVAEMKGYCPVSYVDGKKRYEALIPGHIENAVEYRDKIYIFESEVKLQKFMRSPEKYWDHKLPCKLPPKMEPIVLTSLPLTGYLEQGAAEALIKAINDVGCLKPKFPFLSVKRSALLYIAYHLKAHNHRNSDYIRNKYKKKMEKYVECCELITYLGNKMTRKYIEPQKRPIDFDFKLQYFFSLKDVNPICI
ncbi:adenylate kinase 9 [Spea bombifrons]|uniref:adenylate kinase 9 n=1 Tax=Spea bombifrons TaxID=233779 RepID=UPI0023493F70|nr:adenylate kinase 9 [Spea bombifrons]